MRNRTLLLTGIVMAATSILVLGLVPADAPRRLFLSLLGIFFGLCLAAAGAWLWYEERRATPPAPVSWRRVTACIAAAVLAAALLSPWLDRAIIPVGGIGVAAAVGAIAMHLSDRHVGHSVLAGLLSACAFVLAAAGAWFLAGA